MSRAARVLRLASWIGILWLAHLPWNDLGGVVDERLRWLELWALLGGLPVGAGAARVGRELSRRRGGELARILVYPPAVATAAALVALELTERTDPVGVVVAALVSYCAGVDLSLGAEAERPEPDEP